MSKYSIANTTKEQRAKFVVDALAINALRAKPLTKENRDLLQTYIDGKNTKDFFYKIFVSLFILGRGQDVAIVNGKCLTGAIAEGI
ncbi:MAG: hypothetical protein ACQEW5_27390 [Bacillota bacterium]